MAEPEPVIVNVTAHAFDRASQRVWKVWRKTRQGNEGLATWLRRNAVEAIKHRKNNQNERLTYNGVVFVFNFSNPHPVLQTVMKVKHKPRSVRAIKDRLCASTHGRCFIGLTSQEC